MSASIPADAIDRYLDWRTSRGPGSERIRIRDLAAAAGCSVPTAWRAVHRRRLERGESGRIGWHAGETNPKARLTEAGVRHIRQRASEGASHRAIAADLGVSVTAVASVLRGRSWTHVR